MQQSKRCRICGKRRPVQDFYLSRGKPRAECKKCTLERLKAWQHAHPEQRRVQNQRYYAKHYCPHPRVKSCPAQSIEPCPAATELVPVQTAPQEATIEAPTE